MRLDVNAAGVIKYANDLDKIKNTLLPYAVKNTLNDLAFATKRQAPLVAEENFIIRNKSLFRASVLVNKATAREINSMRSEVGVFNKNGKVAEGLAKQEIGGHAQRGLIQMDTSRVSNLLQKKVKKANFLQNVKLPTSRKKGSGTGFVMIKKGGKGTLFATKKTRGKNKLIPIYSFLKNRRIQIKKRPFIKTAADIESRNINSIFIKNAEKQLKRISK